MLEVFLRLKSQQRELKAVLATPGFGMAEPSVATSFSKYGNNIVGKTNGRIIRMCGIGRANETPYPGEG